MTPSSPAAAAVVVQHLSLAFAGKALFHDFSLSLPQGRWTSLLGASGVGKSTLLRLIVGLEPLQAGSIEMPAAPRLAYMPQHDALLPWLSVLDNVQLHAHLTGQKNAASRERAEALLAAVGLTAQMEQSIHSLSGGQRQRVALARTLMNDAELILMDEPFSALDAITRTQLQSLAQELLAEKTVLLITHDPQEALRLSDTIYVLRGRPVQLSTPLHFVRQQPWTERLSQQEALWQMLTQEDDDARA